MRRGVAVVLLAVLGACGGSGAKEDVLDRARTTTDCNELADIMGSHVFNGGGPTLDPDQKRVFDVALARLKTLGCP